MRCFRNAVRGNLPRVGTAVRIKFVGCRYLRNEIETMVARPGGRRKVLYALQSLDARLQFCHLWETGLVRDHEVGPEAVQKLRDRFTVTVV